MFERVRELGRSGIDVCSEMGRAGIFLIRMIFRRPRLIKVFPLVVEQLYAIGVLSLIIMVVSALFIGMVTALQGYHTLSKFGADTQLGQLVALSLTRELGPVVAGLLFAGRAGSALTAEIGLMKTTEQLSSMEMMGIDPLWRVIYPRFWAGVISLPVLSLIFTAVGIYGGYVVAVKWLGIDAGTFWSNMSASVDFHLDVLSGIIKSIVFAVVVTWIAVYEGYTTEPTAEGISLSTTRTVVYSSLAVLGLDFMLTTIMLGGW